MRKMKEIDLIVGIKILLLKIINYTVGNISLSLRSSIRRSNVRVNCLDFKEILLLSYF